MVVKLGMQILHNFLYFDRNTVQDINDFGIIGRLLLILKQNLEEAGFDFISEVLSTLSKYILVIDPNSNSHLMATFLAQDGLEAMLW